MIESLGLHGYTTRRRSRTGTASRTAAGDLVAEPRTYGHVLVDEAQDLTAMQWRMLSRAVGIDDPRRRPGSGEPPRCARVVGGRARPCAGADPPQFVTLSVKYRTPAEVMDVAARLLTDGRADRRAVAIRSQHR